MDPETCSLDEAIIKMQEGLNLLVFANSDRTLLYGCLETKDLFNFVTDHWQKDLDCFRIPIGSFETLFSTEMIRCRESDTLFEALRKMNDNRVSVLAVQADSDEFTVGLCFMNDLLYLLKLPDYVTYL